MKIKHMKNFSIYIILFFILLLGLQFNLPVKFSNDGISDFDWWSNDIMISDLIYRQNYGNDGLFMNVVVPTDICPDDFRNAYGVQAEMFTNGETFEKAMFNQYTSNIVIQRYIFAWLDDILPVSNWWLLHILRFGNCVLMALVVAGILRWLAEETSATISMITALILSFFCPYFTMYGKNLYWCAWTLFLPMLIFCYMPKIVNLEKDNHVVVKYLAIFVASFSGCLLKQLFYFELVSTAMVAMMIPLIYYLIVEKCQLSKSFIALCYASAGAIASFLITFGIRFRMLVVQYGIETAKILSTDAIDRRLKGIGYDGFEFWSPYKTVVEMSKKSFVSVKEMLWFTMAFGLVILVIDWIFYIFMNSYFTSKHKILAMLTVTTISLTAPLSWFVLAAPHVTVHNLHCTITWFCPFCIMLLVSTGLMIEVVIKECAKNN